MILDRRRYKRCDFLFLTKRYKRHPEESYEQIFSLTHRSIEQHTPVAKLVVRPAAEAITIRIASNERYPWRFAGARIERGSLPVGDYALVDEHHALVAEALYADFLNPRKV